jgi:hypothetical protein
LRGSSTCQSPAHWSVTPLPPPPNPRRRLFPKLWLPYIRIPYWLTAAVGKLTGVLPVCWLHEVYGRKTLFSSGKALRELPGLGPLIPIERCLVDTVEMLVELGMLPAAAAVVAEAPASGSTAVVAEAPAPGTAAGAPAPAGGKAGPGPEPSNGQVANGGVGS